MRALSSVGPLLETNPEILDNIETDITFRDISSITNVPQKWIRDQNAVGAIRKNRAEAQQAAIEQEDAIATADSMNKLGITAGG